MKKMILMAVLAVSSAAGVSYNQGTKAQAKPTADQKITTAETSALTHQRPPFTSKADIGQADVSSN